MGLGLVVVGRCVGCRMPPVARRAVAMPALGPGVLPLGPVVVEPLFPERDAGEWSGLTSAQIEQGWPGFLAERRRPERFEPEAEALARLVAGLDLVHAEFTGGEVIVVTHGGLVHALEQDHGLEFDRLPNLAGRWVIHHGDRIEFGDRLILLDDDLGSVPAVI
jgi:hypothetical protein